MEKGRTETTVAAPGTPSKKASGARTQKTRKQRLQERAKIAGVSDWNKLTEKQLYAELRRIKSEGGKVPDLRENNSGVPSVSRETKIREIRENHISEEVEVVVHDKTKGEIRKEKRQRLTAILDMLSQEALGNKNIQAAKEYLDRTLGKSKQEIEMTGDIKVEEQRPPTKAEKAAAAAYLKALDDEE